MVRVARDGGRIGRLSTKATMRSRGRASRKSVLGTICMADVIRKSRAGSL